MQVSPLPPLRDFPPAPPHVQLSNFPKWAQREDIFVPLLIRFPLFTLLLEELLENSNKTLNIKTTTTSLESLAESDIRHISKSWSAYVLKKKSVPLIVSAFLLNYPSMTQLNNEFPFTESLLADIAASQFTISNNYGLKARVYGGESHAVLACFDEDENTSHY